MKLTADFQLQIPVILTQLFIYKQYAKTEKNRSPADFHFESTDFDAKILWLVSVILLIISINQLFIKNSRRGWQRKF